eukprot:c20641_g1_i1.p1 GENE.c20641_g1_i1~~c20641_g1_i1.p1  ORF type:complete len:1842 (+),score=485.68 c20641_g1_i1:241-5766(+)
MLEHDEPVPVPVKRAGIAFEEAAVVMPSKHPRNTNSIELVTISAEPKRTKQFSKGVPLVPAPHRALDHLNTGPRKIEGGKRFALILINLQNDFFEGGAMMVDDLDLDYISSINELRRAVTWPLVLLTTTQHPVNHQTFSSNVPNSSPFSTTGLSSGDEIFVLPDHCVQGSYGARLREGIDLRDSDVHVESGLRPDLDDTGIFSTMSIQHVDSIVSLHLKANGITDVMIAGLDVDGENILTTIDALMELNVKPHLVQDLIHTRIKIQDFWSLCGELGAQTPTFHQIVTGSYLPESIGSPVMLSELFQATMSIALTSKSGARDFDQLIARNRSTKEELNQSHPQTGMKLIHYLATTNTIAAAAIVKRMLDKRLTSINEACDVEGMTPIMYACKYDCTTNVEIILANETQRKELNLDLFDAYNRTAIMYAIQRRDPEMVANILKHPAGGRRLLRAQDMARRSCLLIACQYANADPCRDDFLKGRAVLEYLWELFEEREFTESDGDVIRWNFWNFAVKCNLSKFLDLALTKLFAREGEKEQQMQLPVEPEAKPYHFLNRQTAGVSQQPANHQVRRQSVMLDTMKRGRSQASLARLKHGITTDALTRSVTFGQNLLHMCTWQRREEVAHLLLELYSEFGLLQNTMDNGMTCLDLVVEDTNPKWQFLLIKAGCVPKQHVGMPMYHVGFRALLLGELDVVQNIVMNDAFGVETDTHLLDILSRAKMTRACTSNISSATSMLLQMSFTCEQCEEVRPGARYCCVCAFVCHDGHTGLQYRGSDNFHCGCSSMVVCACRRGVRSFDTAMETLRNDGDDSTQVEESKPLVKEKVGRELRFVMHSSATDIPVSPSGERNTGRGKQQPKTRFNVTPDSPPVLALSANFGRHSFKRMRSDFAAELEEMQQENNQATDHRRKSHDPRKMKPKAWMHTELNQLHAGLSYRDLTRHLLLMAAAKRGHTQIILELVKWVKPDIPIEKSLDRPLHMAARAGHAEACMILKHHGARVTIANAVGETALHLAARYGHNLVCEVVANSTSLLKMDELALTPMHHAVRNNHPNTVDFLASFLRDRSKVSVDINMLYFNPRSSTLSHSVSRRISGRTTATMPTACDTKSIPSNLAMMVHGECEGHASPLHLAVRYGHVECVRVLMAHGASPMFNDATLFNPYQTAIWEQYTSRKRLEHQLAQEMRSRTHAIKPDQSKIFDGKRLTTFGKSVEDQIADMNNTLPNTDKSLPLSTTHKLIDAMDESIEVEHFRRSFAYHHLFKWVFGYLVVLALFISFSIPRTGTRHNLAQMLSDTVESEWLTVTNVADAFDWFSNHLVSDAHLLKSPIRADRSAPPMGSILLGAVRLRQVRAKQRLCDGPLYSDGLSEVRCLQGYMQPSDEDSQELAWNPNIPPEFTGFMADSIDLARHWRSGEGSSASGQFGKYSVDGYFVDLDLQSVSVQNNTAIFAMLAEPDSNGVTWIDDLTRLLIVELTVYNVNLDAYGTVILRLEFGPAGRAVSDAGVLGHMLINRDSLTQFPSVGFEFAALLAFLFIVNNLFSNCVRSGMRAVLKNSGSWFDLGLGVLLLALLIMDLRLSILIEQRHVDFAATHEFQPMSDLTSYLEHETFVVSVTLLLMWLRLIKYSVLMPEFGRVTFAFMNTMRNFEVVSYLGFMLFVILGFMCVYRTAFAQVTDTSSYLNSFNLLMHMMLGVTSDDSLIALPAIMRSLLFILFMLIVSLIFINLFISVLSEVYPREKKRAAVMCSDNLTELLQTDCILGTHTISRIESQSWLLQLFFNNLVTPVITHMSLVFRLHKKRAAKWNLDVPKQEFGWENGRQFFMRDTVEVRSDLDKLLDNSTRGGNARD